MSLLEAMSYGCCCVTSDIPECSDVLGSAGITFARGDAAALRTALASLVTDSARATTLGESARVRVEAEYNWDAVVKRTLEIYLEGK